MKLSTLGAITQGFWHEIPKHFPFVELGEFVVMPNHIHGILILNKNGFDENGETIDIRTHRPRRDVALQRLYREQKRILSKNITKNWVDFNHYSVIQINLHQTHSCRISDIEF